MPHRWSPRRDLTEIVPHDNSPGFTAYTIWDDHPGAPDRSRTCGLPFRRGMLFQLSYEDLFTMITDPIAGVLSSAGALV